MGESLRQKQSRFTYMKALLTLHTYQLGYELTDGDAYRDERCKYGHDTSLHRLRLAQDFNLFRNGRFLRSTKSHLPLGEYWESIGGTWGGRFKKPDGNHYSLAHKGMM